ncbi:MAG: hypothetical protein P8O06_05990 [Porticoccaceae bacterium]|nr:hypothetical protein [Porticoccaceae bacterium]
MLEWLTVIALSATMVICLKRLLATGLQRGIPYIFTTSVLTLLFLFATGEELSWGQRLFSIDSNAFFQKYNAQNETNFHNMTINGRRINQPIFGSGLSVILLIHLAVLTPLYHRQSAMRDWLDRWAVPIPKAHHVAGYIIILVIVEVIVRSLSDTGRRGEMTEFAGSFWALLNIAFPHNAANFSSSLMSVSRR